ncbi:hypothetical protein HZA98_03050 [Candidatus Woesearchaeota archaeon]|nr:hypothetical protein [Candidatus Woesearchaeota archaeon]
MYDILKKRLETLPKNAIILVIIPSQLYQEVNIIILRYYLDATKEKGIYLSLNRPLNNLLENLKAAKIESSRLHFIDTVTKNEIDTPNSYFLKTQKSMTKLKLALQASLKIKKSSFVILDSLNTLFLNNKKESAMKCIENLVLKCRAQQLQGILLSTEQTNEEHLEKIASLCDQTINLIE